MFLFTSCLLLLLVCPRPSYGLTHVCPPTHHFLRSAGAHNLGKCHYEDSGYEGVWSETPWKFDNSYFNILLQVSIIFPHSTPTAPINNIPRQPRLGSQCRSQNEVRSAACYDTRGRAELGACQAPERQDPIYRSKQRLHHAAKRPGLAARPQDLEMGTCRSTALATPPLRPPPFPASMTACASGRSASNVSVFVAGGGVRAQLAALLQGLCRGLQQTPCARDLMPIIRVARCRPLPLRCTAHMAPCHSEISLFANTLLSYIMPVTAVLGHHCLRDSDCNLSPFFLIKLPIPAPPLPSAPPPLPSVDHLSCTLLQVQNSLFHCCPAQLPSKLALSMLEWLFLAADFVVQPAIAIPAVHEHEEVEIARVLPLSRDRGVHPGLIRLFRQNVRTSCAMSDCTNLLLISPGS